MARSPLFAEIRTLLRRKFPLIFLCGTFVCAIVVGIGLARARAVVRFETAIDLIRIHRGYQGLAIGDAGFAGLLINLAEREGELFVSKLDLTRSGDVVLSRRFAPRSGARYLPVWPFRVGAKAVSDDYLIEIEMIQNAWTVAGIAAAAAGLTFVLLVTMAWLRVQERRRIEFALAETMASYAQQVAHDIRSPLAALEVASDDLTQLPEATRLLIRGSIGRIQDIANDLLDRHRDARIASDVPPGASTAQQLAMLAESVVGEKRLQYRALPRVAIEFDRGENFLDAFAVLAPSEFKRVLSNLINNSVESLPSEGRIVVRVCVDGDRALVQVRDDGKGIPRDQLAILGQKGVSLGKPGGSGLGLYYAKARAEAWGGTLDIASEPGRGTAITIAIPRVPIPDSSGAILIDNDPLIRTTWRIAAERAGKKFLSFASVAELLSDPRRISRDIPIYIDEELGDGVSGAQEARRLFKNGFRRLYLATGHPPEKFAAHEHLRGIVGKSPPWGVDA